MPTETKVQRWGNSLAVRIPMAFAQEVGITEEIAIEISVSGKDLVLSPKAPGPLSLAKLLEGITDENLHDEVSTGLPVGQEIW